MHRTNCAISNSEKYPKKDCKAWSRFHRNLFLPYLQLTLECLHECRHKRYKNRRKKSSNRNDTIISTVGSVKVNNGVLDF